MMERLTIQGKGGIEKSWRDKKSRKGGIEKWWREYKIEEKEVWNNYGENILMEIIFWKIMYRKIVAWVFFGEKEFTSFFKRSDFLYCSLLLLFFFTSWRYVRGLEPILTECYPTYLITALSLDLW